MKKLLGKTVRELYINEDNDILVFVTGAEVFEVARHYCDCHLKEKV